MTDAKQALASGVSDRRAYQQRGAGSNRSRAEVTGCSFIFLGARARSETHRTHSAEARRSSMPASDASTRSATHGVEVQERGHPGLAE